MSGEWRWTTSAGVPVTLCLEQRSPAFVTGHAVASQDGEGRITGAVASDGTIFLVVQSGRSTAEVAFGRRLQDTLFFSYVAEQNLRTGEIREVLNPVPARRAASPNPVS